MNRYNLYAFADEVDQNLDRQILSMKRNALQGLEARNINGTGIAKLSCEEAREVRKKMDDAGLITWSIGSPIGKFKLKEGDFSEEKDKLKHCLELADILGARNLRMFSFYIPKGEDPADYRGEVFDKLASYVEIAKGSGVTLCHENEKGIYGDNAARCREILDAFPEIRGIFDPANFVQVAQKTPEAWEMLKDRIYYMHIKDAYPDGTVVPPGMGEGAVGEIVRDYYARGGRHFTMEPHLHAFDSYKTLEEKGKIPELGKVYSFKNGDEAMDFAVQAFRALL